MDWQQRVVLAVVVCRGSLLRADRLPDECVDADADADGCSYVEQLQMPRRYAAVQQRCGRRASGGVGALALSGLSDDGLALARLASWLLYCCCCCCW